MGTIKWALIGAGDVAERRVAGALQQAQGSTLLGAYRRSQEKLKEFTDRFSVPKAYGSYDEALEDTEVDAVYIATPVAGHAEQTIQAARSGKHVLCEKPMALTGVQAREMVNACREHGVQLGIAYYRRYYPKMQQIRRIIAEGGIGVPVYARAQFSGKTDYAGTDRAWLLRPEISGGGPLMDVGSHVIDQLIYCLGQPVQVAGMTGNVWQSLPVEDLASLLIRFESGCQASVHASFSAAVGNQLEVFGSDGKITMRSIEDSFFEWTDGSGQLHTFDLPKHMNMNVPMIEQFIRSIQGEETYLCPGEEGILTSLVMEAGYRSAFEGRHIFVEK
ncbi:Gfo/Idh/MocA family protein [Paenibacillus silviterrae]|uniref:Gfo/Idh/MocA family protein n=1 Tax=Paenibacillus silviterrae TaxID=3242194 RepID=UPI0025438224|nr:Gfo/Idh/MocA family oxidoreductase [Paenibacillus chinjuensis]